jgi:DNA polymerase I
MGVKVLYGDSVAGASIVSIDDGGHRSDVSIESLFKHPDQTVGGKEYCYPVSLRALSIDAGGKAIYSRVNAIMRHRGGKKMFRVSLADSWHIDVTEDHSLIGYRDKESRGSSGTDDSFVNVRPAEIGKSVKRLVVLKKGPLVAGSRASFEDFDTAAPLRIEEIPYDGYVYDLEIEGTCRFFANGVLVHNTDSIFLHQPTKDQIKSLLGWAESNLGIDLEVDKRYSFVAFSGRKKNYLGVMDNGNVDIKGLMGKKRNTPPFIKDAFAEMTQVLRDVKTPADFENAKLMIKEIVQGCYTGLKARKVPLDGLIFKVMLARSVEHYTKTTPQHVKAAKQLADKGKEVKPGDLISFVKVTGKEGVKPVQLARIDEIDVEKYVGHIQSTFGQVLDALDIEFDEIVGVKRLEFFSK